MNSPFIAGIIVVGQPAGKEKTHLLNGVLTTSRIFKQYAIFMEYQEKNNAIV
jgi:hypothetical protein